MPRARVRRVVAWASAAASAAVLITSVVGYGILTHVEGEIKRIDVLGGIHDTPRRTTTEAVNYLIVGSDSRAGLTPRQIEALHLGRAAGRRSDTMILAHVSRQNDKVVLVSFPRDSLVRIPAHVDSSGESVPPSMNKLNAAFSLGGPQLAVRTIQENTGIAIDHYVEVDFSGFIAMVEALGTVEVCVPTDVYDPKTGLRLSAGRHELDGRQSLRYVRSRSIDATADLGRIDRQQKFIGEMLNEVLSTGTLLNPVRLTQFVDAALTAVRTDRELEREDILRLATRLRGLDPERVSFVTVPIANPDFRHPELGSTVRWHRAAAKALFARIRDDVAPTSPGSSESPGPPSVEVPPSVIQVKVFDRAQQHGLAPRAAQDLQDAGFDVGGPLRTKAGTSRWRTVIRYDPVWNRSVKTVQAAFPRARSVPVSGLGRVFRVVVGDSYSGLGEFRVETGRSQTPTVQARTAAADACL